MIELFAGRFGWSRGFVAEGFRSIGFDIVHESYHGDVPAGCELVLRDVLTIHGAELSDAAVIVASPPCQKYSYMAMPWDLSKREIRWQEWERDSAFGDFRLNDLFDACFRIQREASEAAGHHIPMIVENVKGAQRWVGRAAWHFGSFYLYGDVPALMPFAGKRSAQKRNPDGTEHPPGSWFAIADSKNRGARSDSTKNGGGSWFAQAHNTESGHSQNPVNGVKVPGLNWSGHGQPGYKAQGFNVEAAKRYREQEVVKQAGLSGPAWFDGGMASKSSGSDSRKAASAAIAEIPFDLAQWVARCFKPSDERPHSDVLELSEASA